MQAKIKQVSDGHPKRNTTFGQNQLSEGDPPPPWMSSLDKHCLLTNQMTPFKTLTIGKHEMCLFLVSMAIDPLIPK